MCAAMTVTRRRGRDLSHADFDRWLDWELIPSEMARQQDENLDQLDQCIGCQAPISGHHNGLCSECEYNGVQLGESDHPWERTAALIDRRTSAEPSESDEDEFESEVDF
jgi:hypothetical protein